jgi:hypothetical protein
VCAVLLAKACNIGLVRRRHHDRQRARGRRARRAAAHACLGGGELASAIAAINPSEHSHSATQYAGGRRG